MYAADRHQILCRKEINYLKMSQKERDQLHAEFSILSSLKHEHIVGYYHREHLKHTQELFIYMEYCGGGDLGMVIRELRKNREYASEEFVWRVFSQLVTALYRCHYGVDAPEPGTDIQGQRDLRTVLKGKTQAKMILHRDLKPENIFLLEDQSVKLGDFGLSKLMQSHDFASTYVGTPFYMSPEICAAEKYTLQSDIWAAGCIMYELCTHEPPFNAQTHLQLIQKIRKGDFKPLPNIYSKDLGNVIASCLKTNPLQRPDTASLLTIPYIWIARKSHEVVQIGHSLKSREETAERKLQQAQERLAALEADRSTMREEIEATLRREWELKARLEIDRQVQLEVEKLRIRFEQEVDERVATQVERWQSSSSRPSSRALRELQNPPVRPASRGNMNPHSSITTASAEEDFPSTTDLTDLSDLSIHSPNDSTVKAFPPKKTKTPFTRSKTTFDSPADIQMSEPSPMSISSLALSPRRNAAAQAALEDKCSMMPSKNIFADAAKIKRKWEPTLAYASDEDEENIDPEAESDDDDIPDLPSPTRPKGIPGSKTAGGDPFKMPMPSLPSKTRPGLMRQNTTAACTRIDGGKPSLFSNTASNTATLVRAGISSAATTTQTTNPSIPRSATESHLSKPTVGAIPTSPSRSNLRGLSKIPSRTDLAEPTGLSRSPSRKNLLPSKALGGGRTLVELAQARAGGRPVSVDFVSAATTTLAGNGGSGGSSGGGGRKAAPELSHQHLLFGKDLPPVPVWDVSELGEEGMPSPFLKRDVRLIKGLR